MQLRRVKFHEAVSKSKSTYTFVVGLGLIYLFSFCFKLTKYIQILSTIKKLLAMQKILSMLIKVN